MIAFVSEAVSGYETLHLFSFIILGLMFGSFASALIYRIPNKKPVFGHKDRSLCTDCGHVLAVRDLIPLMSWVMTRGRCRHCGVKISPIYPAFELTSAALAASIFLLYDSNIVFEKLIVLLAVPFLMALFVIDVRHKILPNILILIVAVLGVVRLSLFLLNGEVGRIETLLEFVGGAFVYCGMSWLMTVMMEKILGKKAMGMGDVKFFLVAGLWLGLSQLSFFFILSGVLGVLLGAVWQKVKQEALFPFGPALITAFVLVLLINGSHFN